MGWAERLKKNKRQCASCENERHLPHYLLNIGGVCDQCYRKMTRVLARLEGKPQEALYEWIEYGILVWDLGEGIK